MGNKQNFKKLVAKYNGKCGHCGCEIQVGMVCLFYPQLHNSKRTWHFACGVRESLRIKADNSRYLALKHDDQGTMNFSLELESRLRAPVQEK